MSASAAIRAALRGALAAEPALAGVALHDPGQGAPPPDPRPPYLLIGPDLVADWGWKGGEGRRHRLTATLWSRAEGEALLDAVERAALALPADLPGPPGLPGVRILSLRPERRWSRRSPTGLAEAGIEFRILSVED